MGFGVEPGCKQKNCWTRGTLRLARRILPRQYCWVRLWRSCWKQEEFPLSDSLSWAATFLMKRLSQEDWIYIPNTREHPMQPYCTIRQSVIPAPSMNKSNGNMQRDSRSKSARRSVLKILSLFSFVAQMPDN